MINRTTRRALIAAAALLMSAQGHGAEPVFFPALPETPHYQFLKSYTSPKEFGETEGWFKKLVFGAEKDGDGLGKPYGVAAFDGKLYLCDLKAGDVRVIDLQRHKVEWLGHNRKVAFKKPINIAVDPATGEKFVADTAIKKVLAFDRKDNFLRTYEDPAGWGPTDVAVVGNEMFIVDVVNHKVRVFDRATGSIVRSFGEPGSGEGMLFKPTNIAVGPGGDIYVSDTINFRIQVFSKQGVFQRSIGKLGRNPGDFARPKGIAVDKQGRLYVVDGGFDNVQVFNEKDEILLFIGSTGNDPGQLYVPAKVAVDYDPVHLRIFSGKADPRFDLAYLVWVTNQFGPNRLSVYGFGTWKEPAAVK